ncbi:MAG: hypothetical protein IPI06_09755 [Gammaproteobacteria bacterium]|nr:hypothetical protein [Gammaproteobacteria bacterium]
MPIKVLALHHHAVAAGQTPTEVSAVREFYAAVLGLDADAGRPDFPGIPGAWLDVGNTRSFTSSAARPALRMTRSTHVLRTWRLPFRTS